MRSDKHPNIAALFQPWASSPSVRWRIHCYICIGLLGWLFATLLEHLLWFSLTIPFTWVQPGLSLLLLGTAHLTLFPELASPAGKRARREQTRLLLIYSAFVLVVLPAFLMFLPFQTPAFSWSWPMTLLLALGAILFTRHLLHAPLQMPYGTIEKEEYSSRSLYR